MESRRREAATREAAPPSARRPRLARRLARARRRRARRGVRSPVRAAKRRTLASPQRARRCRERRQRGARAERRPIRGRRRSDPSRRGRAGLSRASPSVRDELADSTTSASPSSSTRSGARSPRSPPWRRRLAAFPGRRRRVATLVRLALAACRAIERLVVDVSVASVRSSHSTSASSFATPSRLSSFAARSSRCTSTTTVVVDGDPVRLRQALDNLIANAIVTVPMPESSFTPRRPARPSASRSRTRGRGFPTTSSNASSSSACDSTDDATGIRAGASARPRDRRGTRRLARGRFGSAATGRPSRFALPVPQRQPETAASSS